MNLVLLLSIFLTGLLAVPSVSQTERMSGADYDSVLAKALDSASSRDRRILTDETFYTGTEITGKRKIVSDFSGPDAKKIEVSEEFNGKKSRSDAITISGQFFCRDGEKAWKRADKECAKAGKMMAIPDGEYEYFVETDAKDPSRKIYTRRAAWADSGVRERDAVRLKFIEIRIVIDSTGIIEYTETRRGGLDPNGWSSTQVTRYQYDVGLKVTDPTREN